MTHKPNFVRKEYAKGFSSVFSTGVADPACIGRYKAVTIIAPLFFKEKLPVDELRQRFKERILPEWHRFRSVPKPQSFLRMAFEEMSADDVDMDYHMPVVTSQKKWTQEDLNEFMSDRYANQKDYDKPLWFFHIIECMEGYGTVLLFDADHALGDGLSMIELLCTLLDNNPLAKVGSEGTGGVLKRGGSKKKRPGVLERVYAVLSGTAMAVLGPILPADMPNALKMTDVYHPANSRAFANAAKIDLNRVKEIKNKLPGTTVNDVMMAVLNLALQRYLEAKRDPVVDCPDGLRASFPINLRKPGTRDTGNAIATSMIRFDFKWQRRQELVWRIKEQIDVIKLSPQPLVEMFLLRVLARVLPKTVLLDVAMFLFSKFTLMLSNVPAPQEAAYVFGREMEDIYYYLFIPIGVYCGMMTYNGKLSFTVASDPTAEDEPELLVKHWVSEFEALYDETMANPMTTPPPRKSSFGPTTMATGAVAVGIAAWWFLRA